MLYHGLRFGGTFNYVLFLKFFKSFVSITYYILLLFNCLFFWFCTLLFCILYLFALFSSFIFISSIFLWIWLLMYFLTPSRPLNLQILTNPPHIRLLHCTIEKPQTHQNDSSWLYVQWLIFHASSGRKNKLSMNTKGRPSSIYQVKKDEGQKI